MTVDIHLSSSKDPKFTEYDGSKGIVVVLMAVASYAFVANGLCCAGCPLNGQCYDSTQCTPLFNCCATGSCTIFCCNCSGVCHKSSLLQSVLPLAKIEADNLDVAIEHFGQFNVDKNEAIDIHEMKQANHGVSAYVRESAFRSIDVNRDGRITIEEFDEDAGRAIQEKIRQGLAN